MDVKISQKPAVSTYKELNAVSHVEELFKNMFYYYKIMSERSRHFTGSVADLNDNKDMLTTVTLHLKSPSVLTFSLWFCSSLLSQGAFH